MKAPRALLWCLPMLLFSLALRAAAAGPGSISGVALDGEGHILAGVGITLANRQPPGSTYHLISGPKGEYRFTGLPLADYALAADLLGYAASAPVQVRLTATRSTVTVNIIMVREPSSSTPAQDSPPALVFQSSGIRGLIDPGGYSASTGSAANGLLQGIANVKRSDGSFAVAAAAEWPCGLEPELQRAVAEHPSQLEANRRMGEFYAAHNRPVEAAPFLQRALAIDASDYAAARALAVAWLEMEDFSKARTLLNSLVSPASEHERPEIHQLLARAEEGLGQFQQAAEEYSKAMIEVPSEESSFGIGYEWILAGSVAEAVTAFDSGKRQYPQSIPLHIGSGTAQFLHGHTSAALGDFLNAADIDPTDPRAYAFLNAAADVSRDEQDRVTGTFKRFLDRVPGSAQANYFYALALSRTSPATNPDRIETLLIRAIQLDPTLAEAHLKLADLYAQRRDYKDSVPEYESAVRLSSDSQQAHYRLALAYKRVGRDGDSEREMQIFRTARDRQAAERSAGGPDPKALAQFVSVVGSRNGPANRDVQCPSSSH